MKTVYFILISLFWGGSFLAINISLKGFSPFLGATLRVGVAAVVTSIYIFFKKTKFPNKSLTLQAMVNGAIGVGIPWALLFWGEQFVEPALCSIINATAPIFTAIVAAIIIKTPNEKMTWSKIFGVFLGFSGIAFIFGPFISGQSVESLWGLIAVVGMAICYGTSIAWLKKLSEHIGLSAIMFLELMGALIVLIPIAVVAGIYGHSLTGESLFAPTLAILYLGIFSTTIAFILFYKLLELSGSIEAAAVTYMIPIVSILLDLIVMNKWIGSHALLGALIVFAALKLINRPGTSRIID